MCGIAGFSLARGNAAIEDLLPLANALAHRGPDGEGFFVFGSMGLAHRRLSIIDVDGGAQPLVAGKKNEPVALVANGEIYNYKALQKLARADGARLKTQSDCEPMLHRYVRGNAEAFAEIEGMYAYALADGRDGTLHLGVDPFGIKPLYYALTTRGFAFASEPRALVLGGWVSAEGNVSVLGGLLNRHYSVGEETLFAGVYRMLPGERMVVKDGKIVSRGRVLPSLAAARDEAGDVAEFGAQLLAAVERHLVADVPYGVLLSGGLDSSALVVAMRELGAPIHAYTAVIEVEGGPNEARVAEALAKKVGATHTTVSYGPKDFWPAVAQLAWAMDDLVTDYAALPLLKLTKRARQDVKILLSGEGGDEMLGGYSVYRKKQNLLKRWLKARRDGDAWPNRGLFKHSRLVKVPAPAVQAWDMRGWSNLQMRQGQDVAGWLANDLLLKLDRTTMANGIEGRVPYLDDTFAAYAFSLPDSAKINDDFGKVILRKHLEAKDFGEMAWARKQGFSVAVGAFLKQKPALVARLWGQSELINMLMTPEAMLKLLGGLEHPKTANLAFSLTLLAAWEKLHLQGVPVEALADEMVSARS
jgi:asparagine synthase (glutamine-hydrolysing)